MLLVRCGAVRCGGLHYAVVGSTERACRCGVRVQGLAEADGLHLAQNIGDGLTALFLGENLPDEGDE
jgi:hypothetical protein